MIPVPGVAPQQLELEVARLEPPTPPRRESGLVFGSSATQPFTPTAVRRRALTAWRRAGLEPIGLHDCRHTFASMMIAAGINAKAISAYLGHASIRTTFDLYGHLEPGNKEEAVALVDAYLDQADTRGRLARVRPFPNPDSRDG